MAEEQGVYETPSEGLTSDSGEDNGQEISENVIVPSTENLIPSRLNLDKAKNINVVNKRKALDRSPESGVCAVDSVTEPDPKKRPIVESVDSSEEAEVTAEVEKAVNQNHSSSGDYDTDDNIPLSQYGSSMGNDREPISTAGRLKTNQAF